MDGQPNFIETNADVNLHLFTMIVIEETDQISINYNDRIRNVQEVLTKLAFSDKNFFIIQNYPSSR
jgi:hypothetical protein